MIRYLFGRLLFINPVAEFAAGLHRGTKEGKKVNYTYILKCKDDSLYTGWTNDIRKRLENHRSGKGAKYTRGRGPLELVFLQVSDTKSEAMHLEAYIKKLSRSQKMDMLKKTEWKSHLTEWNLEDLELIG